jgi:integrase
LAEQVLMDMELKHVKGEYLGVYEEKKIRFADFAQEYLAFAKSTKAPSTYAGNIREMQRLVRAFDGYLSKLIPTAIEKYKVHRSQVVKPARSVKLLKEPPGRLRYLEVEEIEHLLDSCKDPRSPYLRLIVVMALHTGMRLGEILGLRWDDIDLEHRLIMITKTKNYERKTIPINEMLYEELARLPKHVMSPYLFCHPDGALILRIDRSFHSALKRAGIEGFRFHDLRHTFASHLAMRGQPLETIGALLGHKDSKMTKRYAHLSPASLKAAVTTLQDLHMGTKREQNPEIQKVQG